MGLTAFLSCPRHGGDRTVGRTMPHVMPVNVVLTPCPWPDVRSACPSDPVRTPMIPAFSSLSRRSLKNPVDRIEAEGV